MIFKAIKMLLSFLIIVGIIKGIVQYNGSSGGGMVEMLLAIIDGIADMTVRLIPTLIEFFSGITK